MSKNKKEEIEDITDESDTETDVEEIVDDEQLSDEIAAYIKLDDTIKEKKRELKELLKKRQTNEEIIKKYLLDNNKTKIETKDGDIICTKVSQKMPLKEELIEKAIVKKFQDTKKITESGVKIAHDIIEEVNSMRGINIKNNIKRVKKSK